CIHARIPCALRNRRYPLRAQQGHAQTRLRKAQGGHFAYGTIADYADLALYLHGFSRVETMSCWHYSRCNHIIFKQRLHIPPSLLSSPAWSSYLSWWSRGLDLLVSVVPSRPGPPRPPVRPTEEQHTPSVSTPQGFFVARAIQRPPPVT